MAPHQLDHTEIWDDSALVDSWNDALDEYKKYHSIHRNGGNVDDLLEPKHKHDEKLSDAKQSTDDADEPSDPGAVKTDSEMRGEADDTRQDGGRPATQHSHPLGAGPGPVPAGLLGSVRDEGLKRLLMSWYYAGYYTGYYEGQHDAPPQRE
ncbi:Uu.00g071980.m01.CDS01 [Anthostomella pinea]|uniref:Uu.00g071980.m01.CDS01 n=1 Tax=Anthostomella pinea TaxID=933095 RepID=A0AAI8VV11_9PEZI|nr:Uu.00g071980.m01.CDS01 [Anthostomella pinea]